MEGKARLFELRTGEGKVILSFCLVEKEVFPEKDQKSSSNSGPKGTGVQDQAIPSTNESSMTEAQKRFLFRIMADRGIQGELAHEELKKSFGVNALTEATKFEASKMIERLLGDIKGGRGNDAPVE